MVLDKEQERQVAQKSAPSVHYNIAWYSPLYTFVLEQEAFACTEPADIFAVDPEKKISKFRGYKI